MSERLPSGWVGAREAARRLKVDASTVRRWCAEARLAHPVKRWRGRWILRSAGLSAAAREYQNSRWTQKQGGRSA